MAKRGQNEGFRVLDDFVCEAIPNPDVPQANPKNQGQSEGMLVLQEIALDSPAQPPSKQDQELEGGKQRRVGKRLVRVAVKATCVAIASGLGSQFGGWIGASLAALLASVLILGDRRSALTDSGSS
jgi:hypothetical protein